MRQGDEAGESEGDLKKRTSQTRARGEQTDQEQHLPTQYPTYIATSYWPTHAWPTYSPTSGADASSKQKRKQNKKNKEEGKEQDQEQSIALVSPPSLTPTLIPGRFRLVTTSPASGVQVTRSPATGSEQTTGADAGEKKQKKKKGQNGQNFAAVISVPTQIPSLLPEPPATGRDETSLTEAPTKEAPSIGFNQTPEAEDSTKNQKKKKKEGKEQGKQSVEEVTSPPSLSPSLPTEHFGRTIPSPATAARAPNTTQSHISDGLITVVTVQTTPAVAPIDPAFSAKLTTEQPTAAKPAARTPGIMSRPSNSRPTRYYGRPIPSESVPRPLSHGGLGTEVIPTPSPSVLLTYGEVATGPERRPSRQYGDRGNRPSRQFGDRTSPSSTMTSDPTQFVVTSLTSDYSSSPPASEASSEVWAANNMKTTKEINTQQLGVQPDVHEPFAAETRFEIPPTITPTSAPKMSEFDGTPSSSRSQSSQFESSRNQPSRGRQQSKPSRYQYASTSNPTPGLTQVPLQHKPSTRNRPSRNQPSRNQPSERNQPSRYRYESTLNPTPFEGEAAWEPSSHLAPSRPSGRSPSRPSRGRQPSEPSTRAKPSRFYPTSSGENSSNDSYGRFQEPVATPRPNSNANVIDRDKAIQEPVSVDVTSSQKPPPTNSPKASARVDENDEGEQGMQKNGKQSQTSKLNLNFPIPQPTKSKTTTKLNLNFPIGEDSDEAPTGEPTYIIYPTYMPTTSPMDPMEGQGKQKKDKKKKDKKDKDPSTRSVPDPTPWPTYMPTTEDFHKFRAPPSKVLSSGRNHFEGPPDKRPAGSPTLAGESSDWTWSPTQSDGTQVKTEPFVGNEDEGPKQQDHGLSSLYEKRICSGYPFGLDPMAPKQEQEVFFAYGIQTTEGKHGRSIDKSIERMQLWMLGDVAHHLLNCPNEDGSESSHEGPQQSVSRVYYVEDDSIVINQCTPSIPNSTHCAIVQSAIYITNVVGHEKDARADALSIIQHRLERGSYEQGTILHTSYLGPDTNTGHLPTLESNTRDSSSNEGHGKPHHPTAFYVAIGVISIAMGSLALFLVITLRVRRERKRHDLSTSAALMHRNLNMTVDDLRPATTRMRTSQTSEQHNYLLENNRWETLR
ncbi:hypothetical protein ACHAWF_016440 [Thalassiosira exigua]